MTAIVTSLLGGGWELVAGWILPTALNSVLFAFLVLPSLRGVPVFHDVLAASHPEQAVVLLSAAVVGGLVLSAFQTSLYRVLEGYSWPAAARRARTARQLDRKRRLERRLRLARLAGREQAARLTEEQAAELASLRDDKTLSAVPLSALEISVLAERLRRYPVDDGQLLPTRLGNAIRRFEEYGWDRYRLDIITMWHALNGVAGDQVRKEMNAGRASTDFFVCLIWGHAVLALAAVAALFVDPGHPAGPAAALASALILSILWYWLAVLATDEWAAAVRGLVDTSRKPLAAALGLRLPPTLELERTMWELVSRQSRRPHQAADSGLDPFRDPAAASPGGP